MVARQAGRARTRWIVSGGSFQSASAPWAHFGLPGSQAVDLEVTWPDGFVQRLERVPVDRRQVVERPARGGGGLPRGRERR